MNSDTINADVMMAVRRSALGLAIRAFVSGAVMATTTIGIVVVMFHHTLAAWLT